MRKSVPGLSFCVTASYIDRHFKYSCSYIDVLLSRVCFFFFKDTLKDTIFLKLL